MVRLTIKPRKAEGEISCKNLTLEEAHNLLKHFGMPQADMVFALKEHHVWSVKIKGVAVWWKAEKEGE